MSQVITVMMVWYSFLENRETHRYPGDHTFHLLFLGHFWSLGVVGCLRGSVMLHCFSYLMAEIQEGKETATSVSRSLHCVSSVYWFLESPVYLRFLIILRAYQELGKVGDFPKKLACTVSCMLADATRLRSEAKDLITHGGGGRMVSVE